MMNRHTPPHILTLIVVAGMSALSMNVFLPSLPGMARYFGVDYAVMQLSVSGYLAVSAVLQLLIGPITDRLGRRQVLLWVLAVFVLATIGTLAATTAEAFLAARMLQAAVATGMVISRATVRDLYPGDQAASMIGYVTMGMALVPMIGPILGGFLDEYIGWQANFALLLIVGAGTFALIWADMGETSPQGGIGFRQQLSTYPVLLRSQRFWGYALAAACSSGQFFAYLGGAPFVGEQVFHLSSSEVGYFFALPALGYGIGNFLSGRYAARVGMDRMILGGTIVTFVATGFLLLSELAGLEHPVLFFGSICIASMGSGMTLPSSNSGLMSVRPELAGTASGLGGTMMIGGGAGLSAIAGLLLQPGSGALPLVVIMWLTTVAALGSILWVLRRNASVGLG